MSSYWERRAELDMKVAQDSADKILERIQDYHKDAAAEISDMATRIRKRFAASYGLSDDDADKMLAQPCGREEYMQLLNQISRLGKNNPRRRYLMAKAAAPSYSYRISLQESMRDQLSAITSRIAEREEKGIRGHLMDVVDDQSKRTAFNLAKQSGIGFQFGGISEKLTSRIISTPWSGRSFSARVWTNQARLEELLNRELRNGILNGASIDKTSQIIAEAMDVSMHRARCLVRTETTYAANQADLQTYSELGISSYRYVAMLDSRTSEICRKLDGQTFKVSEAQAGKNFPPMHPYCRSRTISNLEDQDLDKMKRIARDPETGEYEKVPATMAYKEWEDSFALAKEESRKWRGGKTDVNWPIVQSEEYRAKFDKITDDPATNQAIYQRAIWALNNRSGTSGEEIYAIDKSRKEKEIARVTNQNYNGYVLRTKQFEKSIKESNPKDLIILHNHPRSTLPSNTDINELFKMPGSSGIIACHNGDVYYYSSPKRLITKDDDDEAEHAMNSYSGTRLYQQKILEYLAEKAGFEFRTL